MTVCRMRVDLPMPGSPPNRMRLPGTMPPPNTRLSSVSPVSMRGSGRVATCRSGLTVEVSGRLNRGKGIPIPSRPLSIEFKNVSYKYPEGEKKVLDNISFRIEAGEKIALVGLNGAGKTTTIRSLLNIVKPDSGSIKIFGTDITENETEIKSRIAVVFDELPFHDCLNAAQLDRIMKERNYQ